MTQIPILVDGQLSSVSAWANPVANAINKSVLGGDMIIELALTPAGTQANELRWSTVHQAMMRWTGTQWRFADGAPAYMEGFDYIGFSSSNVALASGTAALTTTAGVGTGHPGVILISSSASANSGDVMAGNGDAFSGANPGLRYRGVFMVPASGFVAGATHRIGLHDATTSADAVDGCYLEVVNATASFKTAAASTRTTNATTATLIAGTWYTVHVWFLTTTTARCVVINDAGTVMLDVTNVANVPTNAQFFRPCHLSFNSGTAALALCNVDYMGAGYAPI